MKNLKTTMIAALLMLAAVGEVVAQEKWEYSIVGIENLKVVVTGQNKEKFPIEKALDFDVAVMRKVQEMAKEGWEVVNAAPTFGSQGTISFHVFYLRRKVKE
jgi:hypothetical protein